MTDPVRPSSVIISRDDLDRLMEDALEGLVCDGSLAGDAGWSYTEEQIQELWCNLSDALLAWEERHDVHGRGP